LYELSDPFRKCSTIMMYYSTAHTFSHGLLR
jgi:hypothetical protein